MLREGAEDRPILVVAGNGEVCGYERRTGRLVWKHERVWATTHREVPASGFALGFPGNVRQGDDRGA